eukprot:m.1637149 g.1637149  ORF g.1637149 m.1637149 type:complete len:659 (+) comp25531_c0_seq1:114-2090(+)
MAVPFKVFLDGTDDVRRFRLTDPVSVPALTEKIRALLDVPGNVDISIKWEDDEGDRINVLHDADITVAIAFHHGRPVRLYVKLLKPNPGARTKEASRDDENDDSTTSNCDNICEKQTASCSDSLDSAAAAGSGEAVEEQDASVISERDEPINDNAERTPQNSIDDKDLARHERVSCDVTGMFPIKGVRWHYIGRDYDLCQEAFDKLPEVEKVCYERIDYPRAVPVPYTGAQVEHHGIECDKSGMCPIIGCRYKKIGCDYDLCEAEFQKLTSSEKMSYVQITHPNATPAPVGFPVRFDSAADPAEQAATLLRIAMNALHDGYDIDVRLIPRGADPRPPENSDRRHHLNFPRGRHHVEQVARDTMHAYRHQNLPRHGSGDEVPRSSRAPHPHRHPHHRHHGHHRRHRSPPSAQKLGRYHLRQSAALVERGTEGLPTGTLRYGSRGPGVEQLQWYLISKGMMKAEAISAKAGYYGPRTCEAIRVARHAYNIKSANASVYDEALRDAMLRASNETGEMERVGTCNSQQGGASIDCTFQVYEEHSGVATGDTHAPPTDVVTDQQQDSPGQSRLGDADNSEQSVEQPSCSLPNSAQYVSAAVANSPPSTAAETHTHPTWSSWKWPQAVQTLHCMGFIDDDLILPLLERFQGSVERVLAELCPDN